MSNFKEEMRKHQVAWRQQHINCKERGWHNCRRYDHVLPRSNWQENLWGEIRGASADSLPNYIQDKKIQAHSGTHNLLSSWILCTNLYFPFRQSPRAHNLLASFLKAFVSPDIEEVTGLELEFALTGDLSPSVLLGETGGKRGSGQTSPDMAFLVTTRQGGRGLVLTESKFTEHSFYPCSARRVKDSHDRPGNPDPSRCLDARGVLANPQSQCHQTAWGRHYWERLKTVADIARVAGLKCCPALRDGYQLLRQQALAQGIGASGEYGLVVSCVAYDSRNTNLIQSLWSTGIPDWRTDWGSLFGGTCSFAAFAHQQWVAWVHDHDRDGEWRAWLDYMQERYGFGEDCTAGQAGRGTPGS